ncbi:hypothetical protein HCX49_20535 [Sphingobacterium kitahiroshimense]|uniref:hypothetical protein n=1 Tax=Sphingobacterium sp. B16(2022) TaxID=2914044 RepID=UPI00143C1AFC|nr:hypothetical protein [Sphingobacterium sp. B16(2022)]NJI75597.1 hypothetical protein [Sphingobacterium sp. B16(2022)]
MWYKIRTGDNSTYRGWNYSVTADSNNDLRILITSPYAMDRPIANSGNYEQEIELFYRFMEINATNTYSFKEKVRVFGIFSTFAPNIEKGHNAARKYIDQRLGDFNLEKFYKTIM